MAGDGSAPDGEAAGRPGAGPPAAEDEEAAADRAYDDPELSGDHEEVARHEREMNKLGAETKGEGRP